MTEYEKVTVLGKSAPELLAYWIQERENIRLKKEQGLPKPWSEDPVFQNVYFTNIRREDDKVTRWIRQNYTMGFMGPQYEFSICVARIFNRPETLVKIRQAVASADFGKIRSVLTEMQGAGEQIWSGAYLITTHGRKMTKLDYCLEILEKAHDMLRGKREAFGYGEYNRCRDWHTLITMIEGFGSFLAAQVVADLKNTEGHPLQKAEDWWTFSAPGPGSLRGLSWFFGKTVTERNYYEMIGRAWEETDGTEPISMQDFQNCLCEFDKYCRVASGLGRSKRKYPGV